MHTRVVQPSLKLIKRAILHTCRSRVLFFYQASGISRAKLQNQALKMNSVLLRRFLTAFCDTHCQKNLNKSFILISNWENNEINVSLFAMSHSEILICFDFLYRQEASLKRNVFQKPPLIVQNSGLRFSYCLQTHTK